MENFYLGIDYGTGGAKACLIDTQGNVLGYAFEEYPIIVEKTSWSEHDPHLYWEILCRLCHKVVQQAHIQPKHIKGIAVSSALPSMVMIDKKVQPIHRAYNLMDRRATEEVAWLKRVIGEDKIFKITANRLDDHPLLVNLLWEKNNRPKTYQAIDKILTIDGYITLKLSGKPTLNYSAASFYGVAYDIIERNFHHDILEQLDINPSVIPQLYKCEDIIGEVTTQAANETGLNPGTPIAAGQVDCNAGWLGGGAIEVGDIQMNLGTCGNFGIIHQSQDFLFSPAGFSTINFAYTVNSENTYITVPTTTTGGQSLRYLRDNYCQAELQVERTTNIDSYELLNLLAQKVPLGSEGLIILPFLMGERTPIWDVNARGVVFGLSLNHSKGHIVRAIMEGVAYALYDSFQLIQNSGTSIKFPLVLNEGGAKSQLWRRIITDVFNVPTVLVKRRTGAPFGDAILAGVATGTFKDFSVAKQWAEYIDLYEPNLHHHEQYLEYFNLYKKVYEHLKQDFIELAQLRKNLS